MQFFQGLLVGVMSVMVLLWYCSYSTTRIESESSEYNEDELIDGLTRQCNILMGYRLMSQQYKIRFRWAKMIVCSEKIRIYATHLEKLARAKLEEGS